MFLLFCFHCFRGDFVCAYASLFFLSFIAQQLSELDSVRRMRSMKLKWLLDWIIEMKMKYTHHVQSYITHYYHNHIHILTCLRSHINEKLHHMRISLQRSVHCITHTIAITCRQTGTHMPEKHIPKHRHTHTHIDLSKSHRSCQSHLYAFCWIFFYRTRRCHCHVFILLSVCWQLLNAFVAVELMSCFCYCRKLPRKFRRKWISIPGDQIKWLKFSRNLVNLWKSYGNMIGCWIHMFWFVLFHFFLWSWSVL